MSKAILNDLGRVQRKGVAGVEAMSVADIALESFEGNVAVAVELPEKKAVRALKKLPSIGEPGAEKFLLVTRARSTSSPGLAPDPA